MNSEISQKELLNVRKRERLERRVESRSHGAGKGMVVSEGRSGSSETLKKEGLEISQMEEKHNRLRKFSASQGGSVQSTTRC